MKAKKKQVRLHFGRAADTYDNQAVVQERVANHLLSLVDDHTTRPPDSALEIGCCTGILTRKLVARFPQLQLLHVNDLVETFSKQTELIDIPGQVVFLAGDVETLLLPEKYQLIISSSTFHWLHDLPTFFAKLRCHIHLDGLLAFAMYGPKNLREIKALAGGGLEYPSLQLLVSLLEKNFEVLSATESLETLYFTDPTTVLQHLRETGVNALARTAWTKTYLHNFCRQYQDRFSVQDKVCLSYHPMYLLVRPHQEI